MSSSSIWHRQFRGHGRLAGLALRPAVSIGEEGGSTLIELLVVCLIIGVLAAIAIPTFSSQRAKAVDAQAKALARAGQTVAEAIAVDNSGSYEKVTLAELNNYEPSIRIAPSTTDAYLRSATAGKSEYSVTAKATTGDEFTIARDPAGAVTRECVSPVTKTGCGGAEKGSW